jgi:hypothetical protein
MTRELEFMSHQLREEQQRIMEDLAAGNAKDHGAYQHACGVIRGLLIANNVIREMAERLEKEDE